MLNLAKGLATWARTLVPVGWGRLAAAAFLACSPSLLANPGIPPEVPRLELLDLATAQDPQRGEVRRLGLKFESVRGEGSVSLEISAGLAGWSNVATFVGPALQPPAARREILLDPETAGGQAFFRLAERAAAEVRHESSGRLPTLLSQLAYGVDEEASFDLEFTRFRIEHAEALARSNNFAFASPPTEIPLPGRLSKFHFWPNILDLTEIYYSDEALYARIVAEILALDPRRTALAQDWLARVQRSERLFLARDFVDEVASGGLRFEEVHYAFVVNLDARFAEELLAHPFAAQGLGPLRDPLIPRLNDLLVQSATLPLGEVWHLCLRGNLRRNHQQAIIVDKLAAAPAPEFFVARIHQNCLGGGPGGPPTDEPPPEEEPPPIKNPPPRGGDGSGDPRPPSKIPGAARPPERGDQPPVRPWPEPEKEYVEPPGGGAGGPAQPPGNQPRPGMQNERAKIQALLDQARRAEEETRPKVQEDLEKFRNMSYEWIEGVTFHDPCVQAIYDKYAAQVAELKKRIAELAAKAAADQTAAQAQRTAAAPAVRALISKEGLWINMITVGGAWSNVRVPCFPPLIPSGGFDPTGVVVIGAEAMAAFHNDLVRAMMNGRTWDQAVAEAIADPERYPEGVQQGDKIYQLIWKTVADCYRRLFTEMFRIYLKTVYPDLTDEQREKMIPGLFDGEQALTEAERAELEAVRAALAAAQAATLACAEQIAALEEQIKDLLRKFREEARLCFDRVIAGLREHDTMRRILEAAAIEAATPGAPGSVPAMGFNFCEVLRRMLGFPDIQNCPGLRAYLQMLLQANCHPPGSG